MAWGCDKCLTVRGAGPSARPRPSSRRGLEPGRGRAAQPLDVAQGRLAEEPLVLPAEVRRIAVTHPVSGGRGVDIAGEKQPPGLLQPELLLKLQRAHRGDRLEVVVEARNAHPELPGEAGD